MKNIVQIEAYEGSIALSGQGEMYVWGPTSKDTCNIMPQKVQNIPNRITKCNIGKYTYAAIDEKDIVWVWGDNK